MIIRERCDPDNDDEHGRPPPVSGHTNHHELEFVVCTAVVAVKISVWGAIRRSTHQFFHSEIEHAGPGGEVQVSPPSTPAR